MTSEAELMADVRSLIKEGVLHDDPNSPTLFIVTVVGSQRSDREDDIYKFITDVAAKHPSAEVVVGDTSTLEKSAALAAEHQELPLTVIAKAAKGEWNEGSDLRDERVVAASTQVVAFDTSARSTNYKRLAKRMSRPFHLVK